MSPDELVVHMSWETKDSELKPFIHYRLSLEGKEQKGTITSEDWNRAFPLTPLNSILPICIKKYTHHIAKLLAQQGKADGHPVCSRIISGRRPSSDPLFYSVHSYSSSENDQWRIVLTPASLNLMTYKIRKRISGKLEKPAVPDKPIVLVSSSTRTPSNQYHPLKSKDELPFETNIRVLSHINKKDGSLTNNALLPGSLSTQPSENNSAALRLGLTILGAGSTCAVILWYTGVVTTACFVCFMGTVVILSIGVPLIAKCYNCCGLFGNEPKTTAPHQTHDSLQKPKTSTNIMACNYSRP